VRGISLDNEAIRVSAEGINEMRDRTILLTRIQVHYDLTIPAGSREKVDRALSTHVEKCPTARSLEGAVEVGWTADIKEV
jgi:uncharacterized OsmC-like protein